MKYYVIGKVGSGKSRFATELGLKLNIPVFHLDQIVHDGNIKREIAERDKLFQEILLNENYIVEDVGRSSFTEALQEVDKIIFLDLPTRVIKTRILKRFVKQKLGLELSTYRPTLQILKLMLTDWQKNPEDKLVNLKNVTRLKSREAVKKFLIEIKG